MEVDELLRLGVFSPHVDTGFQVQRGSDWVTVTLTEAKSAWGHRPVVCEKFSLIFTGGLDRPLQQGTHAFEHAELGAFELFITPVISQRQDHRLYQAVINRETGPA